MFSHIDVRYLWCRAKVLLRQPLKMNPGSFPRLLASGLVLLPVLHVTACQSDRAQTSDNKGGETGEGGRSGESGSDPKRGTAGNGGSASGGAGGANGGAGGGSGGAGGSGGRSGSGTDAGAPDAMMAAFDPKTSFAAGFDGHRWEVPCQGATYTSGETCGWDPARFAKKTKKVVTFTGAAGKVYEVSIRVRGVVEPRTYTTNGRVADLGAKPSFLVGGAPVPGNDYNIYRIVVSNPAQTYHLNSYKSVGHLIFDIDYQAKILVEGGATVSLEAEDSNTEAIANYKRLVVPGILPAPEPYNGQFIQLDVINVQPKAN